MCVCVCVRTYVRKKGEREREGVVGGSERDRKRERERDSNSALALLKVVYQRNHLISSASIFIIHSSNLSLYPHDNRLLIITIKGGA